MMGQGCHTETKMHTDPKREDRIHVYKMCPRHLDECFTSKGHILPTEFDLNMEKMRLPFELPEDKVEELTDYMFQDFDGINIFGPNTYPKAQASSGSKTSSSRKTKSKARGSHSSHAAQQSKDTAPMSPWDDVE